MEVFKSRDPETGNTSLDWTKIALAVIAGIFGIAGTLATAWAAKSVNQVQGEVSKRDAQITQIQENTDKLARGTAGTLEKGQKLCRVLQGKTWRDGLIVPQDWKVIHCQDYMKKTKGSAYQLGCIYTDGTNLGGEDGSLPSPNCDWQ